MIYIGIDPGEAKGKEGALAMLNNERDSIEIYDCPKTDQEIYDLLMSICYGYGPSKKVLVTIEKASKAIRIGNKTYHATVLWGNYRAWLMACCCLRLKTEIVPPRRWQSKILDGNKKLTTKERAWEAACRLYPKALPLLKGKRGAKKFGRSDALCIMEWGRRNL